MINLTLTQQINAMSDLLMSVKGCEGPCDQLFAALSLLEIGVRAAENAIAHHELCKVIPGLTAILWMGSTEYDDEGRSHEALDRLQFLGVDDEVLFTLVREAEIDLYEEYSAPFFRTLLGLPPVDEDEEAELTDEEYESIPYLEGYRKLAREAWSLAERMFRYEEHHEVEEGGRIEITSPAKPFLEVLAGRIMHNVVCDDLARREEIRQLLAASCEAFRLECRVLGDPTLRNCVSLDALVEAARKHAPSRLFSRELFGYLDHIGVDLNVVEQAEEVCRTHGQLQAFLDRAMDKVGVA